MARPKAFSNLSLSDLERIVNARKSELGKLNKQRSALQKQLAAVEARIATISGGPAPDKAGRARNAVSLGDAVEAVLTKAGAPLPVGEIMSRVQAAGYRSNATSFRAILNQTLIKDSRFGAKSRGIYQLKK